MILATALVAVVFGSNAFAINATYTLKPAGAVTFLAIGRPNAIKIKGEGGTAGGKLEVKDNAASGDLSFDLNTLKTGIDMRDRHMKEKYLETGKFPQAKLTFASWPVPEAILKGPGEMGDVPLKAMLTLHGETKPIEGKLKLRRRDATVSGDAEFTIKISNFGIAIPSFTGITVAEDVAVAVNFSGDLVAAAAPAAPAAKKPSAPAPGAKRK